MLEIISRYHFIFNILIIVYIIYQLLGVKVSLKRTILIVLTIFLLFKIICLYFNTSIININTYILVIVFVFSLFRVSSLFQVFICTVITMNIVSMVIDIFLNSLITFNNTSSSTLYYDPVAHSLVLSVFLVSEILILALLKYFKLSLFEGEVTNYLGIYNEQTKNRKKFFNKYNLIILAIVVQMWLFTMYFQMNDSTVLNISWEIHSIQQNFLTLILCLAIIFLNIIVIFMIKNILISQKEQYQYKIKEKEFSQIQQHEKIIRQYKHDLSNHFKVLNILSTAEKIEELKSYLANYQEDFNSNLILVNTGSEELDILMNSKINIAQMKNIVVKYSCIADIKCEKRHIINLISIIANVLDNAIEASERSKEKLLKVEITENTLEYVFKIRNSIDNCKLPKSDILLQEGFSNKGSGRGFGLQIVNRLVKKYYGRIEILNKIDYFEIKIELPKHKLEKY